MGDHDYDDDTDPAALLLPLTRLEGRKATIEFAATARVDALASFIDVVVEAILGHQGALVTDQSQVSDFADYDFSAGTTDDERKRNRTAAIEALALEVSAKLGIPVGGRDFLVDVADRLAAKRAADAGPEYTPRLDLGPVGPL